MKWRWQFLLPFMLLQASASTSTKNLSIACETELQHWMHSVPISVHPDNATLTVDWTELDRRLTRLGCSYGQLWLELWRVSRIPEDETNFGSADYFEEYERCNELNDQHFVYHSTKTHAGPSDESHTHVVNHHEVETTFLHVVEENYILRLCPCGRRKLDQRVCDCDYGSGKTHCSGLLKVETQSQVFPICTTQEKIDSDEVLKINSPGTVCDSLMLSGKLKSCTPIQSYDKVRITLHRIDLRQRMAETGIINEADFKCEADRDFALEVFTIEQPLLAKTRDEWGEFSFWARNLTQNSSFCIQVELVDHPYCNVHHTVGHEVRQPVVCVNSVHQPIVLPFCKTKANVGTSITSDSDALEFKIMWGVLACLVFALMAAIACGVLYCRRQKTLRNHYMNAKRNDLMMNDSPILKFKSNLTTTLYSHHLSPPGETFLLHFPETKAFEQANKVFRDYVSVMGCHVYDLSDPKNDERISEDPEGWVINVLNKQDVRIIVVDSPLARLSLSVASSSTASTSLVSSSASVECRNDATAAAGAEVDLEEEEEVRIPLSLGAASRPGPPLPESAVEDNHHELRVFALRQIQSRYSGKYNQLVVLRLDGFASSSSKSTHASHLLATAANHNKHQYPAMATAVESVAQTLTPHKECLVLPQHLPELRSWLHGHAGHFISTGKTGRRKPSRHLTTSPGTAASWSSSRDSFSEDLNNASYILESKLRSAISALAPKKC